MMYRFRTDLAEELRDHAMQEEAAARKGALDGIRYEETMRESIRISAIDVKTEEGARRLKKPQGRYVTFSFPKVTDLGYGDFLRLTDALSEELSTMLGKTERILICGLGNDRFAADALGVLSIRHILVTHHLKQMTPHMEEFGDLAAITPGIMAKTGMESADIVKSAVETIRPDAVLVIDAMAAREATRLARTLQLSDTGLFPGSGLGNHRKALNAETLGVPTLALGVPTVVDAATLVSDALMGTPIKNEAIEALSGLFVSPKEIDLVTETLSKVIGYAVNRAVHGDLPYEEMAMLA